MPWVPAFKNGGAEKLARQMAAQTGKSLADAIIHSLRPMAMRFSA